MFTVILAVWRHTGGIGWQQGLPWYAPEDLRRFRALTTSSDGDPKNTKKNAVIMGHHTWQSLPHRPLSQRLNVVLSRKGHVAATDDTLVFSSLETALAHLRGQVHRIFVIGGAQLFQEALQHPHCERVLLTRIMGDPNHAPALDTFVEPLDPAVFRLTAQERGNGATYSYLFETWTRLVNPEEQQYLDLVRDLLQQGHERPDRTQVGVRSSFGHRLRFDLQHHFPLLTTKRVFFRGVVEELLWFLRGHTNAKLLRDKGVRIWDGNASRSYLDSIQLYEREEDDLGPIYGFQWRHFGAQYRTMHDDYEGQGVDQLARLIALIRTDPTSRRLLMSAWNPCDLQAMALPPCHVLSQFYVHEGKLSCQMYQRSGDMGLGVPFNVASYALLTYLLAHITGLVPGELIHVLGDAHVYRNHEAALAEQLRRTPRAFPTLTLSGPRSEDWSLWQLSHFQLQGYDPHDALVLPLAV